MKWLTREANLKCEHGGKIAISTPQDLVFIAGQNVLVHADPEGKSIHGCPNYNVPAGMKPCTLTLTARQGYSSFVRIEGRAVCLDTLTGLTDGTPPGIVSYRVRDPGQSLVEEKP